ncbi:hypothetical protein DEO72_LG10g2539 [Vigna unguiculata]|uniref:NAC domain-containing protein n=1 Tax=Vigna unguiculata TaxID=3917 RepID=A0A4D6NC63_VIGUN|nr:hypothetical protein DEO72_LG10g2539 [Vigna unguiculata]
MDSLLEKCGKGYWYVVLATRILDLPRRPAGVKFDPFDQDILEHLEAKVCSDFHKFHPLIDEFIPNLEGENRICCTHPKKLQKHVTIDNIITEAYWGEAKKGGFWPWVSTEAIGGTFLPRFPGTRSHRGTSLTPPLALLRSSSPPRSSANAVVAKPSPALNEQLTATLRPMLPLHGLNATTTNHHEPVEPRDLEIQHLHLRLKHNFNPLLRATLPLCRHHHRRQRKRVTTKSRLCREPRACLLRQ